MPIAITRKAPALATHLSRATAATATDGESLALRRFLLSPEVEAIAHQLFATGLHKEDRAANTDAIRREFYAILGSVLRVPLEEAQRREPTLFDAIVSECNNFLTAAIENGVLSAHEALSERRHQLVLDQIANIQRMLEVVARPEQPDVEQYAAFETKYRDQIRARHGTITPPDFYSARKMPVDALYVPPRFHEADAERPQEGPVEYAAFVHGIWRSVVLGNPGGGKSTFSQKLCWDLATKYEARFVGGRRLTPILIVLRDYGAAKSQNRISIVDYIESASRSLYQLKPPPGAFDYLLRSGRVLVIFDGLDELLETSTRQEISGDVEVFCNLYPTTRVLVTSREVGYDQAPLDPRLFNIARIATFSEMQVQQYVRKWFEVDSDLSKEQREQKSGAFLRESEAVPDLRSNPLMLALLCNIYRGENYIPKNRPDVYEKCATMLFEKWDKSRGLQVPLPFEHHISPTVKYLAHWIYATPGKDTGVTEHDLINRATEYLLEHRFDDRDEAERAATEFVDVCRGRAWVFTDTGTTRAGERLYQFTHRTFLEYFAASHLFRTHPTPEQLQTVLLPRIAKREWDVVAQLALQIQNKNVERAGDKALLSIVDAARTAKGTRRWNLLSFAARCLEFVVARPSVVREVVQACVEASLQSGDANAGASVDDEGRAENVEAIRRRLIATTEGDGADPEGVFKALLRVVGENRESLASTLEPLLTRALLGDDTSSLRAYEIVRHVIGSVRSRVRPSDVPDQGFWDAVADRMLASVAERLSLLRQHHLKPAVDAIWDGQASVHDLVESQGIDAVFQPPSFLVVRGRRMMSVMEVLCRSVLDRTLWPRARNARDPARFDCAIDDLASILVELPPPWLKQHSPLRTMGRILSDELPDTASRVRQFRPSENQMFVLAVGLAAIIEAGEAPPILDLDWLRTRKAFPQELKQIITALATRTRLWPDQGLEQIPAELLAPKQLALLDQWRRRELDFIGNQTLRVAKKANRHDGSST